MTAAEEEQLSELSKDLAKASADPAEPRSIVRAFATPQEEHIALTMQNWIDLESIRSPLLHLRLPDDLEELERAANVFRMSVRALSSKAAVLVARGIRRAIAEAFSLALPMRRGGSTAVADSSVGDGFGAWLPLFAFLVAECGLDPHAARELRVDQAFALLAACRRNQGWEPRGVSYAQRDAAQNVKEA
ncbi:MAG TPA: hypothetical protein VK961_01685 [Chthoniobacter sp.]|nr:hypothetical protein [Chthoniobacter sp.]